MSRSLPAAFHSSRRLRWPTALLAVSLALIAVGILEATRASRSQTRVADNVLRDYSRFASWSYRQHLSSAMSVGLREILGEVNHGDNLHISPKVPRARELAHYLPWNPSCACYRPRNGPSPAIFFAFSLGSNALDVGINTHPDPSEGWEIDRPLPLDVGRRSTDYSPEDRRWVIDTLTRQIRRGSGNDRFNFVIGRQRGEQRFLAYTLMPTLRGDTMVYGAEYAREAVIGAFAEVLYESDLLPAPFTRGRSVADLLQVEIRDRRGHAVLEPRQKSDWRFDASDTLPPSLGSLVVHAQVLPTIAGDLVIGGLPRSRLPFLLALLGISGALAIVAIGQIRRDVELARLRGDFVSSVSHDLRTPLAQMRLYLETLRLGRFKTEEQRTASIAHVERETARLSQLVERVLRFSSNGTGDDGTRIPVDAAAEVRSIVEEFRPLAESRRASVVAEVGEIPTLRLAPEALRHVLLNLLDNAVKYGPPGQTVRVHVGSQSGVVRFSVSDEGPGVPPAERERVFAPFQRGSATTAVAGSGIGLAIVRDIAVHHGGRAWVENGGPGANFVVELPVTT